MTIPTIRSITDLARDAKALVEQARKTQEPIVITQRGREAAVVVPIELYRRLEAPWVVQMPSLRLVHPDDAALLVKTVVVLQGGSGGAGPPDSNESVAEEPGAGL